MSILPKGECNLILSTKKITVCLQSLLGYTCLQSELTYRGQRYETRLLKNIQKNIRKTSTVGAQSKYNGSAFKWQ